MNGAGALAGILSGRINPSGKLAITFPWSTGQIPIYYNRHKAARKGTQGRYKDITSEPLYPFGHGLSYTTYEYSDIRAVGDNVFEVTVTNTGSVGWYGNCPLVHFRPVLQRPDPPGERVEVF